jgi:hypothetical protein
LGTEPLLPLCQPFTKQEVIGFVIGSVSSMLYLFSRLPQIRTNVSIDWGWVARVLWVEEWRGVGDFVQEVWDHPR